MLFCRLKHLVVEELQPRQQHKYITNFARLCLCFPLSRLKHLVVQELQPQQQQQQAAHQLKLQQAALVTAAAAAAAAAPGGTAAVPLPTVVPPPLSGVVVVAPAPPTNPKWVDRPRTSLHARAYLRLGMWQWSMNEVGGGREGGGIYTGG